MAKNTEALVSLEEVDARKLFLEDGETDKFFRLVQQKVPQRKYDVAFQEERDECKSMAYRISRTKTALDNAGKDLVADAKKKIKSIDARRKLVRDELDRLKEEIRKPLTEYEEKQKKAKEAEELARKREEDHEAALAENLIWEREQELKRKEEDLKRKEIEQAAAERARRETEERMRREREEAEHKRIEAEERKKAAERAKQEQAEQLKRDKQHQQNIETDAIDALVQKDIPIHQAEEILQYIVDEEIPHVHISYEEEAFGEQEPEQEPVQEASDSLL